jgi:hypothetical protein
MLAADTAITANFALIPKIIYMQEDSADTIDLATGQLADWKQSELPDG